MGRNGLNEESRAKIREIRRLLANGVGILEIKRTVKCSGYLIKLAKSDNVPVEDSRRCPSCGCKAYFTGYSCWECEVRPSR